MQRTPTVRAFLPLIVLLLVLGWGGLFVLVNMTEPTIGPRWLFYFLIVVAFTGLALPAVVFLHVRFPTEPPPEQNVIVRQALWVGVYTALLIWMSFGQVVSVGLAIIFLVGFVIVEILLRLRERSFWRPRS
ncbi:MAG TPA: hypothetical protein DCY42_11145 [Chloroflexi bacterium]|nr:hypothetical protein [Chloroflexota bacterium]